MERRALLGWRRRCHLREMPAKIDPANLHSDAKATKQTIAQNYGNSWFLFFVETLFNVQIVINKVSLFESLCLLKVNWFLLVRTQNKTRNFLASYNKLLMSLLFYIQARAMGTLMSLTMEMRTLVLIMQTTQQPNVALKLKYKQEIRISPTRWKEK